ncbi:MAG: hypothetical protein NTU90_08915 [Proteobacteria bacterium]|nr:hypothetical protein [Pseudomonadota bacterium]
MTERKEEYPTEDALQLCNSIRTCSNEYLDWLRKRPKDEIIDRFLGIIYSKFAYLPVVIGEETPPDVIDGIKVDSIKNILYRRTTKSTLLLIIQSESEKLGFWNQIQKPWTEKYISETKGIVEVLEIMAKSYEASGYGSYADELHKNIKVMKEQNKEYAIDW